MFDTVVFDLDGTLLNTLEDLTDAVNYVLTKYGWEEHSIDRVRMDVGNGIRKLIERSIEGGTDNPLFEEVFLSFKEYYQAHCQVKTRAYPGIMETLKKLKEMGVKMAIVSNKANGAVEELNRIYFEGLIDVALGENEDAGIKKKPSPEMVNLALEKLGSSKEHSLYVGDSDVDKMTADNSGLQCVLCEWGFRDAELLHSLTPLAVIKKPAELINIVK